MQEVRSTLNSPAARQQRPSFPLLAPRDPQTDSADEHATPTTPARAPRLSHRSRAGCWTCRGRKVKCDEQRPVCGPCARLNRECDWDHRWNFNDATIITQGKHTNVTTAGNAVWDPSVRAGFSPSSQSYQHDDLPAFDVLRNDEERERKAEIHSPGTFGVVVTPDSFADLPEYASAASPNSSRHNSVNNRHGSGGSPHASTARSSVSEGSTTIVLQHFEDVSTSVHMSHSSPATPTPRRSSFPEYPQTLSISASLPIMRTKGMDSNTHEISASDSRFLKHFKCYIVPRLVQPAVFGENRGLTSFSCPTQDVFQKEAARFRPLHHAMCAVGALNLAYAGLSSLEEAMQHYQEALTSSVDPTKVDEILSDGVFLRHFLLFIYDICVPISIENGGASMWGEHLRHLLRLAIARRQRVGHEPLGYIVWTICELDMYACTRGSGNCNFIRTVVQQGMLPELHEQIPNLGFELGSPYQADEAQTFPAILALNQRIVIQTAELAQQRDGFCANGAVQGVIPVSPGQYARWQVGVSQAQSDLLSTWSRFYPSFLEPESVQAGFNLPPRARFVFEHALALFYAAVIYSRTSMYPRQRLSPVANQPSIVADTERRCAHILALTATHMLNDREQPDFFSRRRIVFPIFMAGFATSSTILRGKALDLLRRLEGNGGIGRNTFHTRKLLVAVAEAQHHAQQQGMPVESVDWLSVAQERGLNVVNCGL